MPSPSVSILILNYRLREQVRDCLRSLQSLNYPNFRDIVIDNDSGDGIEAMVKAEFPEAVFIQTGVNSGYTGGNNRGFESAMAAGADYALVLNPDTVVVNPDFLTEIVGYLETHRRVGIAGPRIFLREAGVLQNTVLYAPGVWRNVINWFRYRLAPESLVHSGGAVVEAEVLNGVCLLIRLDCLREIGLFDEEYFMYIEDADMDHRAWKAGWAVHYLPIDSVIHRQKRDVYQPDGPVDFFLKRNSVYYLVKYGRRGEAIGFAILALLVIWWRGLLSFDQRRLRRALDFGHRLVAAWRQIFRNAKIAAQGVRK